MADSINGNTNTPVILVPLKFLDCRVTPVAASQTIADKVAYSLDGREVVFELTYTYNSECSALETTVTFSSSSSTSPPTAEVTLLDPKQKAKITIKNIDDSTVAEWAVIVTTKDSFSKLQYAHAAFKLTII